MSETESTPAGNPEILAQAAAWLMRLQSGEVTQATLQELEIWCEQSDEHRSAWARAQSLMGIFERVPARVGRATLERVHNERRRRAVKALAFALVAIPVGWTGYRQLPLREWRADYRTLKGAQKSVVLADDTRLDLNTASAVNVVFSDHERRIILLGGEIRVTTGVDSTTRQRPLIVATGQGQVQPVGTRFSVRQLEGATRLAVFAGQVVTTTAGGKTLRVQAGQQTQFNRQAIEPVQPAVENRALWEQGMLLARAMPLGELLSELVRYRRGVLRCDPAIADLRVSGAFPVYDTDASLALLQASFPLQVWQLTPWWVSVKAGKPAG